MANFFRKFTALLNAHIRNTHCSSLCKRVLIKFLHSMCMCNFVLSSCYVSSFYGMYYSTYLGSFKKQGMYGEAIDMII